MTRQQQLDEQKPCLFLSHSFTHSHNLFFFLFLYPHLSLSLSEIPMDVTLSSNPQTLTLISCTPFSSSSSSKLRSIRREFLGSTQTLRPLRSRTNRRRTKLGLLQFQSPKFLIRASLDSRSVLIVVAVVTFSVVSVFFLNRYRRKSNDSEVRQL